MKGNIFIKLNLWLQPYHLGSPMAPFQIPAYKHFKILKDSSITGNLSFPTLYTHLVRTTLFRVKNVGFGI